MNFYGWSIPEHARKIISGAKKVIVPKDRDELIGISRTAAQQVKAC